MRLASFAVAAAVRSTRTHLERSGRPGERCRRPDRRRGARCDRSLRAAGDARAGHARALGRDHRSYAHAAHHHAGVRKPRYPNASNRRDALCDRLDYQVDDGACHPCASRCRANRSERTGTALPSVVLDRERRQADSGPPASLAHGGNSRRLRRRNRLRLRPRSAAQCQDALRAGHRHGRTPTTATRPWARSWRASTNVRGPTRCKRAYSIRSGWQTAAPSLRRRR